VPRTEGHVQGEPALWLRTVIESYWPVCIVFPYNPSNPYGLLSFDGALMRAHDVVCRIRHGSPPSRRHQVAHWCGNKRCVNWRHLRWATPAENMTDRPLEYR